MPNESHVFFFVTSYDPQDVAEFTRATGVEPTTTKIIGEADQTDPTRTVDCHIWQLVSPLPKTAHVNKHIGALLKLLEPRAEAIRLMTARLEAGIQCQLTRVWDDDQGGYAGLGVELWQPTINSLAHLNLSVAFDFFFI